jgi:hypothetical protein
VDLDRQFQRKSFPCSSLFRHSLLLSKRPLPGVKGAFLNDWKVDE